MWNWFKTPRKEDYRNKITVKQGEVIDCPWLRQFAEKNQAFSGRGRWKVYSDPDFNGVEVIEDGVYTVNRRRETFDLYCPRQNGAVFYSWRGLEQFVAVIGDDGAILTLTKYMPGFHAKNPFMFAVDSMNKYQTGLPSFEAENIKGHEKKIIRIWFKFFSQQSFVFPFDLIDGRYEFARFSPPRIAKIDFVSGDLRWLNTPPSNYC